MIAGYDQQRFGGRVTLDHIDDHFVGVAMPGGKVNVHPVLDQVIGPIQGSQCRVEHHMDVSPLFVGKDLSQQTQQSTPRPFQGFGAHRISDEPAGSQQIVAVNNDGHFSIPVISSGRRSASA
jgi:hypothetical protein